MNIPKTLILILSLTSISVYGQYKSSSEILNELEKLKSPYRVLYLAAHPDDENTRLISYFSGHEKAEVAYLSLTRGGGGQNLIGSEKGTLLGVLRTEELLAARRIDGGKQFFTHAVDFGYSKTSSESFKLWGKDEILGDVVYVMRSFKPHIVVNRFPPTNYAGHGHHQASAILSQEAFDLCQDTKAYPDQLKQLTPWNPGCLYFNSSSWWDKTLAERAKNDQLITEINIGLYNSNLGYSYNELAALSRSQHKSQGFGSSPKRGDQFEYLEYIKGLYRAGTVLHESLLDSIDLKWLTIGPQIETAVQNFDAKNPANSVAELLELRKVIIGLVEQNDRFNYKLENLETAIIACLGLSIELRTEKSEYTMKEEFTVDVLALNRSDIDISLNSITFNGIIHSWNRSLDNNQLFEDTLTIDSGSISQYSNPYWINEEISNRYHYPMSELSVPGSDGSHPSMMIALDVAGYPFQTEVPIKYFWTDRVKGGLNKNIRILPEVSVTFDEQIYFPDSSGKITGNVILTSHSNRALRGNVFIKGDTSLRFSNMEGIQLESWGSFVRARFEMTMSQSSLSNPDIELYFVSGEDSFNLNVNEIEYDHIRPQIALLPSRAKIVPIDFNELPGRIAYLPGPDNEWISFLRSIGCDITEISESDLQGDELVKYDVLLYGIRSINVNPSLKNYSSQIQSFIKKGGNVVVMYQTSRGINPLEMAPYPFEISRKRVTDENAVTRIIVPEHDILNHPYKLTEPDFTSWNQERGLYFAGDRSEDYQVLFAWKDEGEDEELGSIIVGDYGKGAFIYTGISFFRHIPAGVPGSYKLLLNILSYNPDRD